MFYPKTRNFKKTPLYITLQIPSSSKIIENIKRINPAKISESVDIIVAKEFVVYRQAEGLVTQTFKTRHGSMSLNGSVSIMDMHSGQERVKGKVVLVICTVGFVV